MDNVAHMALELKYTTNASQLKQSDSIGVHVECTLGTRQALIADAQVEQKTSNWQQYLN
jgi:hypothetical protein